MELVNPTPMKAIAFRQFDQEGGLDCVVALRGTFTHVQGDRAAWAETQEDLCLVDLYEGDPHASPLLRQTDLTPGKTGTDVTFLGAAHAPGGVTRRWRVGLEVGPLSKWLTVTGPRRWQPRVHAGRVDGWHLSDPESVAQVPLDWRSAQGGRAVFDGDEPPELADRNPIGRGRLGPAASWRGEEVAAPQVLATDPPGPDDPPAGFGPVPPFWQGRYRHAGTYDAAWENERHPLLPRDFDPRFWQSAPEDQVVRPFLRGDEPYRLTHMHPSLPVAEGRLPGLSFGVRADASAWRGLDLDGVLFDWRADGRLCLTWRTRFALPEARGARLTLAWAWLDGVAPRRGAA